MSVCRDVYFSLVGRSPVDRLRDGRQRVGPLTHRLSVVPVGVTIALLERLTDND